MCVAQGKPQCKLVAEDYSPSVRCLLVVRLGCWKYSSTFWPGSFLCNPLLQAPDPQWSCSQLPTAAGGWRSGIGHVWMSGGGARGAVGLMSCASIRTGLLGTSAYPWLVWQVGTSLTMTDMCFHMLLLVLKQSKTQNRQKINHQK